MRCRGGLSKSSSRYLAYPAVHSLLYSLREKLALHHPLGKISEVVKNTEGREVILLQGNNRIVLLLFEYCKK